MYIFALVSWPVVWAVFLVVIGLSAVIFVHELGHFLVAKLCGVQCDKFYIGFDVPIKIGRLKLPSALWKKKWGETEYGIGILPLGGYVKMLGQDDNPAKISEEMQRAQEEAKGAAKTKEIMGPDGEKFLVHPRSYLAKSIPQRMAIISAGVIMNVIFAFIFAVIAYGFGVSYMPCIVSNTVPGSPAWQANLQPGDEIIQLGEKRNPSFIDLRGSVTLGDLEKGIDVVIRGHGQSETRELTLKPEQDGGLATIGLISPHSLRLSKSHPIVPFTPAGKAKLASSGIDANDDGKEDKKDARPTGFESEDEIVAVNGRPVENWRELSAILATEQDKTIEVTVRRGGEESKNNPFATRTGGQEWTYAVEPRSFKRLGLVMKIGKIVAVQKGSPADEAGVKAGDFLRSMNGEPIGDPVTWPNRVRNLAKDRRWITLEVKRPSASGEAEVVELKETMPRVPDWVETTRTTGAPMSCPALGVAYRVLNSIDRVVPGSPADKAGFQSGSEIIEARIKKGRDDKREIEYGKPMKFGEKDRNWPSFVSLIQTLSPETTIELTYKRHGEGKVQQETLKPYVPTASTDEERMFNPYRGFRLQPVRCIRYADTVGEGVQMGWDKTVDSLGMVYRFLCKIGGQVPISAMGGPITIAKASYYSAFEGIGKFLVFLTILSANLAVLNFLPIPILDGGHMVFLAYEGVRGRPPNERLVVAMHMIGFALIISLMVFVFALDLGLIERNL